MGCISHPDRDVYGVCANCGNLLCNECAIPKPDGSGNVLCSSCNQKLNCTMISTEDNIKVNSQKQSEASDNQKRLLVNKQSSEMNINKFDPSQIELEIEDLGYKDDIDQQGITSKPYFNISITNKSLHDIKWLVFETITTFIKNSKEERYVSSITNGNSGSDSYRVKITCTRCYKTTFGGPLSIQNIQKNIPVKNQFWINFTSGDKLQYKGTKIYRIFGELDSGEKFQQLRSPELKFDNSGYFEKTDTKYPIFMDSFYFLIALFVGMIVIVGIFVLIVVH